ncbi:MAG: peptidylprolyl isomerase [Ruminococcus sp.]|nr:peptidylprolyl isomerase [Ruminococcus sp.]
MIMRKYTRYFASALAMVMMMGTFAGCSDKEEGAAGTASGDAPTFIMTLYPDVAPISCENFENLVSDGFYDGLTFHRVVDEFMAQGGDPAGNGTGGSAKTIKGEFALNGVENNLSHQRGVVSMARSNDMDSASSQFFICYTDCSYLDGQYAAFGEVTEGMEVVDSFLQVERSLGGDGAISSPNSPITISKAVMIDADEDGNPRVQFTMEEIPVAE